MKQPGVFLKVLTATGFVLLLSVFVAYRAGSFSSPGNATANVFPSVDSPVTFADTSKIEIMPSSKSGPVFNPKKDAPAKQDTGKPKQQQQQTSRDKAPNQKKSDPMMGSSKSGVIFTPEPDTSKPQ
jgi:hypothetical protein